MSEFKVRTRLKELRAAIKNAESLEQGGYIQIEINLFLVELALDLSKQREGDESAALRFVLHCMHQLGMPFPEKRATASAPAPLWKWPVIMTAPGSGGFGPDGMFHEFSALKMFGYTVGKTRGWARRDRHAFLRDFMTMTLPPIVSKTFGKEYGAPLSTDRLRKVGNVIATNASNFARNDPDRYAQAIADWEDDLAFLKREFYEGKGLKFQPWPSSR